MGKRLGSFPHRAPGPSPVLAWRGGGGSPARMASMSSADEARRTLAQLSRERVRGRLQLEPDASGLRL